MGPSRSEPMMQFQSRPPRVPVVRSAVIETTALGAAISRAGVDLEERRKIGRSEGGQDLRTQDAARAVSPNSAAAERSAPPRGGWSQGKSHPRRGRQKK